MCRRAQGIHSLTYLKSCDNKFIGHARARSDTAVLLHFIDMDIQTKETTRADLEAVRFGGRTWQVVGRHYDTVTLEADGIRIYVEAERVEPITPGGDKNGRV